MLSSIVEQWSSYSQTEWIVFVLIFLIFTAAGGVGGTVCAHLINCAFIYHSDFVQILSQPGGDLDLPFWFGFLGRMISINLLLSFVIAFPTLLMRKPLLRFDSWFEALWYWRLLPQRDD